MVSESENYNKKKNIQSEVIQKEKDKYCMLTQKYGNWKDGTGDLTCGAAKM